MEPPNRRRTKVRSSDRNARATRQEPSVVTVELVPPGPEQLQAAEERIAELIAQLWQRGLLAPDDSADDK